MSDLKKVKKKRKNGMSNLKKIGKMGCKVAKNEKNPDQRGDSVPTPVAVRLQNKAKVLKLEDFVDRV